MFSIEDLKKQADNIIEKARFDLLMQDGFLMTLIANSESQGPLELNIDLNDVSKDDVSGEMKQKASDTDITSMIMVFDAYTLAVDIKDKDKIPASIEKVDGRMEAVTAFIYTRDVTLFKRVLYEKKGPKNYWSGILEWEEVPEKMEGRFMNPFLKGGKQEN